MANVLIASLGESPIVVTAMYNLLTIKAKLEIDEVVVLYPEGGMVKSGYDLIEEALSERCKLTPEMLGFKDADSTKNSILFLQKLYQRLTLHENCGDEVYLSLAGGRKNMSALMAWVVPFFPCVQKLYHVIDKDEGHFISVENLTLSTTESQRKKMMDPELEGLILIDIPFEKEMQLSDDLRSRLLSTSAEELFTMFPGDADRVEAIEFSQGVAQGGKILDVLVTRKVEQDFKDMCERDVNHARDFETCFERMRFASILRNRCHDIESVKSKHALPVNCHYYKQGRTDERPVFYTLPKDIKNCPDDEVEKVVVCSLEIEREGKYKSIEEIRAAPKFSLEPVVSIDALPSVKYRLSTESILIVPLGASPMVATQLYRLLTNRGYTIREVVLIYPERSRKVRLGAEMIKEALNKEAGVSCRQKRVSGLEDIDSTEACQKYQQALEATIEKVRGEMPGCQIELALSGGRKGMAALAMFAAQHMGIRHVYHTLITDEKLSRRVEDETTLKALDRTNITRTERNDRLFLRSYQQDLDKFILFKVPVVPAGR